MIYKGAILNLRRDKVTVTGGGTSYREIVEHNGGAVAAAITSDNKMIMVRQFRKAVEQTVLEVPAGKIEAGEDPLDTMRRELKEETGYTAGKLTLLTDMWPSVGYTSEKLYIYLAQDLMPGEPEPDDNEAIDILEMPINDVYNMVLNSEIKDAKTIVAVLLAKKYTEPE